MCGYIARLKSARAWLNPLSRFFVWVPQSVVVPFLAVLLLALAVWKLLKLFGV